MLVCTCVHDVDSSVHFSKTQAEKYKALIMERSSFEFIAIACKFSLERSFFSDIPHSSSAQWQQEHVFL